MSIAKLSAALLLLLATITYVNGTALDDYVWKADEAYGWTDMGEEYKFTGSIHNRGYTAHILNMTSQRWLTDADFSPDSPAKSLWWHYLVVIVPDDIRHTHNGSLWITGGGMTGSPPKKTDEDIIVSAALATSTHTVSAALFQIPNEHTIFSADPIQQSRTEDAIIAFTWDHFLKDPSDPVWLVRFPMIKASLRAMDATKEFMQKTYPEKETSLDYYTVAGASKRGWTTWLVGAVDKQRVVAIVPIVLDAINFVNVEHHQFRSYGGWTWALKDYTQMNLTTRFDDPNMPKLQAEVDPYQYKDRLTMPKLVVNAAMDEFQQPDDLHYWWSEMPEPKHFMMLPNTEHSCATGILEVVPGISAWVSQLLLKETVPHFTWKMDDTTGTITVTLDEHGVVEEANMWYAHSCGINAWDGDKKRRDFRIAHLDQPCNCGISSNGYCVNLKTFWSKEPLNSTLVHGRRTYTAKMDAPEDGNWVAYFVDIKYRNKNAIPALNVDELAQDILHQDTSDSVASQGRSLRKIYADNVGFERKGGKLARDLRRAFEFTSEVMVWPQSFPYEDCDGESCGERLL